LIDFLKKAGKELINILLYKFICNDNGKNLLASYLHWQRNTNKK